MLLPQRLPRRAVRPAETLPEREPVPPLGCSGLCLCLFAGFAPGVGGAGAVKDQTLFKLERDTLSGDKVGALAALERIEQNVRFLGKPNPDSLTT